MGASTDPVKRARQLANLQAGREKRAAQLAERRATPAPPVATATYKPAPPAAAKPRSPKPAPIAPPPKAPASDREDDDRFPWVLVAGTAALVAIVLLIARARGGSDE